MFMFVGNEKLGNGLCKYLGIKGKNTPCGSQSFPITRGLRLEKVYLARPYHVPNPSPSHGD